MDSAFFVLLPIVATFISEIRLKKYHYCPEYANGY